MEKNELRIGNWYKNKSNDENLMYQQITFFEDAHYVHQLQNIYFALTGTELVLQERGQEKV